MGQRSRVATELLEVTSQSDVVTLHNGVESGQTYGQQNKLQAQPYAVISSWRQSGPGKTLREINTAAGGTVHTRPIQVQKGTKVS
jgi:hypothetical protein